MTNALNHRLFLATIVAKGILGIIQVLTAAILYMGLLEHLPSFAQWLVQNELAENPNDYIALKILQIAGTLPTVGYGFYVTYFAAHGLLHVAVVAALLSGARWANHAAVIVLLLFVVYQTVEWFSVGGYMLIVLTVIDLAVVYLTIREHQQSISGSPRSNKR
ncbi:MAG: putative membrane protein [Sulfitobacter sp.]